MIPNPTLTAYFCKRFHEANPRDPDRGHRKGWWEGLGIVYAASSTDAWTAALAQWGQVDSLYPLDYCE